MIYKKVLTVLGSDPIKFHPVQKDKGQEHFSDKENWSAFMLFHPRKRRLQGIMIMAFQDFSRWPVLTQGGMVYREEFSSRALLDTETGCLEKLWIKLTFNLIRFYKMKFSL